MNTVSTLDDVRGTWDHLGATDAMVAVIGPIDSGDWDADAFLELGREEIKALFGDLGRLGEVPAGRALDFGCGLGRLTQALCERLGSCDGVDIAESMLEGARRLNRYGDGCRFHLNQRSDLSLFDDASFDLVYSGRVLQHMPPEYAIGYMKEFVRVTRPGGMIVFQVPSRRQQLDPLESYAVELKVTGYPDRLVAGSTTVLHVAVTNRGPVGWAARGPGCVRVGNHWRSEAGEMIVPDDGRAGLPGDLAAKGTAEIDLMVRAPAAAGRYRLDVEPVQEEVAWFADRGFEPVGCIVDVVAAAESGSEQTVAPELPARPRMEMHPVKLPEVVGILEDAGARIVAIINDAMAPGWESYRYFATPRRVRGRAN
jgi:SAM-dependent methyltransferase